MKKLTLFVSNRLEMEQNMAHNHYAPYFTTIITIILTLLIKTPKFRYEF